MRRILLLLILPLAFVDHASAHHAFAADYEAGNEGVIEGEITEVIYKNPHARYYLEVTNDDGGTELWDLQTMNLMMLGRVGWTKDTLQVGDKIKVEGILGRNDTRRMSINVVTVDDGRVISPQRGITESNADLNARNTDATDAAPGEFDSVASNITPGVYELEEDHAYLSFSYSHMGLSHPQLQFTAFDAELRLDGNDMSKSEVSITIDAASIDTTVAALDDELRGEKFFDVGNNPQITFSSTGYEETSESGGKLTGDLTVLGISKSITLDVTINSASMNPQNRREMIGFSATGTVNRSEFGMDSLVPMVGGERSRGGPGGMTTV